MPATSAGSDRSLVKEFPLVYEEGKPTAILVDIDVFRFLLGKLDELEDRELLGDPKVVARLEQARQDHLAGRLASHAELIGELEQSRGARSVARRANISMAELIRRAVDDWLARYSDTAMEARKKRALEAIGCFHSGLGDVSENHDEYLAEAYGDYESR